MTDPVTGVPFRILNLHGTVSLDFKHPNNQKWVKRRLRALSEPLDLFGVAEGLICHLIMTLAAELNISKTASRPRRHSITPGYLYLKFSRGLAANKTLSQQREFDRYLRRARPDGQTVTLAEWEPYFIAVWIKLMRELPDDALALDT